MAASQTNRKKAPEAIKRARMQAALYYARKKRKARVAAQSN